MTKRIKSIVLTLLIAVMAMSGLTMNISAFDIDETDNFMHYAAADMARLLENTNIYSAHYYGQGYNGNDSVETRLRERSTSMLYQHFAEMEEKNDVKAVFSNIWSVLNTDMEKFSGLTETDFYSGVLWAMLTGSFNISSVECICQVKPT